MVVDVALVRPVAAVDLLTLLEKLELQNKRHQLVIIVARSCKFVLSVIRHGSLKEKALLHLRNNFGFRR